MYSVDRVKGPVVVLLLALLLLTRSVWAGPKIESWNTSNGARVLFVAAPDLPMVDLRVVFDAGSARDADKSGLSTLTNALLTEGAGEWNADQLAERLEALGIEMSSGALRDMAWVSVRTLKEEKPYSTALETLTAVLGKPRFDATDLERNRQMLLLALRKGEQNPSTVARKAFLKAIFGSHPYASDPDGTKASLSAITGEQVKAFHRRYYVAANATLAIVGDLSRAEAEKVAEQVVSALAAGEPALDLTQVKDLARAEQIVKPFPSSQSHILMGQPGMQRGDPDYFQLYVGNHILGGSGLVSLLSEEVREKRGLSYSVYSYFSPMRRNGPFIVGAQTKNARAGEALEVIRDTLQRYIEQGPTEKELTAARQNITGGFPLRISSNSKIVEYLTMIGFYDRPLDYLDTFVSKVNAVTREQIRDAFQRRLHLNRMVTVVVGNGKAAQSEG
jgi:zinc protease